MYYAIHLPYISEPILHLDGRRLNSKIAVVHREHPLFSNFAALLNRIHTLGSHKAVCVDPAFIGTQFPAASCPAMDKCAFAAFVLDLDDILGSKPNVSHSSSSYNCLDRYNNFLHYTIDNMRWADSATNFQNKPKSSQYNGGMEKRLGKKIDTQFATLRRILTKQKSKPTLLWDIRSQPKSQLRDNGDRNCILTCQSTLKYPGDKRWYISAMTLRDWYWHNPLLTRFYARYTDPWWLMLMLTVAVHAYFVYQQSGGGGH